jgi:hypothetical protein
MIVLIATGECVQVGVVEQALLAITPWEALKEQTFQYE